ncbi:MAG TPA: TRAP transporter small permease [Zeimonas sp.]|nr:TRAP transporter small permease [Zeimonas sp.]
MRTLVLRIDRWLDPIVFGLACTLLAIVSCIGLYQVVARFVLEQPSIWSEEVVRRLLIWMVMLGVAAAFRRGAQISVDVLARVARGRRWERWLRAAIATVTLAFLAVLAWFGFDLAWRIRFQTSPSLEISMAWAYLAIPVGAVLSMFAVVANLLDPQHRELETAT